MNIYWQEKAWLEYLYWQIQDKKTLKRINNLIKDIERNGYNCTGKPGAVERRIIGLVERSY